MRQLPGVLDRRVNWRVLAKCKDLDAWTADALYFGDGMTGRAMKDWARKERQRLCGSCPVVQQCGEYALMTRQRYGAWGGIVVRRKQKRKVAA
jgi:WhiB family transcriptional regulator, redox-sensing transcriptional regulator